MNQEIKNPLHELPQDTVEKLPAEVIQKIDQHHDLRVSLDSLSNLFAQLKEDVDVLRELGGKSAYHQVWRRAIYRAAFSWIEGVVYQMKQVALKTQGGYYQAKFTRAELIFLLEEAHGVNKKGLIESDNTNYLETQKNLQFAFSKLAQGFGVGTILDKSVHGWEKFTKAIKVRNRLTHPKAESDLNVSDDEMNTLQITISWFQNEITKLIQDANTTVQPMNEKIKNETKREQEKYIQDVLKTIKRGGEIEDVIKLIDTFVEQSSTEDIDLAQLIIAKEKLNNLRIKIVQEIGNNPI